MNLLHDVDPGDNKVAHVIIEIPRGSKNKYEIDKKTGLIALDRAMHTAQDYPMDYGFIPQTLWDDDDALDAVVLTTYSLHPSILVRVRLVGIMHMDDSGDRDDKIICVPVDDPRYDEIEDINDVNKHTIKEIQHFFETYKGLQKNKVVKILGVGDKKEAQEAFDRGRMMYKESSARNNEV